MPTTLRRALPVGLIATLALAASAHAADPISNATGKLGTIAADVFHGTAANDVFNGLDGNDHLTGGSGNDNLDGASGDDVLDGGSGNDTLLGRSGNDVLTGGAGSDQLDAGSGDDKINARDGYRDDIFCGGGHDTVVADQLDTIAPDCESVSVRHVRAHH